MKTMRNLFLEVPPDNFGCPFSRFRKTGQENRWFYKCNMFITPSYCTSLLPHPKNQVLQTVSNSDV